MAENRNQKHSNLYCVMMVFSMFLQMKTCEISLCVDGCTVEDGCDAGFGVSKLSLATVDVFASHVIPTSFAHALATRDATG